MTEQRPTHPLSPKGEAELRRRVEEEPDKYPSEAVRVVRSLLFMLDAERAANATLLSMETEVLEVVINFQYSPDQLAKLSATGRAVHERFAAERAASARLRAELAELHQLLRTDAQDKIDVADLLRQMGRLREANRELFGAVVRVSDPNVTPIEARLRGYSFRCRSKEEWVPFSDCLLGAAEEIERLRESNKALKAAISRLIDRYGQHSNSDVFQAAAALTKATEGRDGAAEPTKGTTDDPV